MDVRIALAEGDDAVGVAPCGLDQPVSVRGVVGDDCHAVGLEAAKNLALGVGDCFFRAEVLDVCRGDRGDDCDVRPDLAG